MKAVINSYKTAPNYITKGKEYDVTWGKEGHSIKFIADNGKECVDQLVSIHFKGVKWKSSIDYSVYKAIISHAETIYVH